MSDDPGEVHPVTPEEVLSVFEDATGNVVGLDDLTGSLECSTDEAERALGALEENGLAERWETSGGTVWSLTIEDPSERLSYETIPADEHYSAEDEASKSLMYEWAML